LGLIAQPQGIGKIEQEIAPLLFVPGIEDLVNLEGLFEEPCRFGISIDG
jgi:hypothetical protein